MIIIVFHYQLPKVIVVSGYGCIKVRAAYDIICLCIMLGNNYKLIINIGL